MENPSPAPPVKLLDQVRAKIRLKHYSIRTEQAYADWIKRFILYFDKRHPTELGAHEVEQFLTHLAVCAFFVVHMLGNYGIWCSNPQLQAYWLDVSASALMALFAFYEAAFDVGLGRRRMQLATGLMAAYLGCAALSGSGYLILYFGCAVWALTDLCSLTPKPKQENAA